MKEDYRKLIPLPIVISTILIDDNKSGYFLSSQGIMLESQFWDEGIRRIVYGGLEAILFLRLDTHILKQVLPQNSKWKGAYQISVPQFSQLWTPRNTAVAVLQEPNQGRMHVFVPGTMPLPRLLERKRLNDKPLIKSDIALPRVLSYNSMREIKP